MVRSEPGSARALTILVLLAPLWLVGVALHVNGVVQERLAWVPLYIEPAAADNGAPVVRGFWPGSEPRPAGAMDLAPGDVLLRAGDAPLEGVGRWGFVAIAYEQSVNGRVPFTIERDGRRGQASLALLPLAVPWRTLPLILGLGLTAAFVLVRRGNWLGVRAYALAAIAYALHWSLLLGGPAWQTHAGLALLVLTGAVAPPLAVRAALLAPGAPGTARAGIAPAPGDSAFPSRFVLAAPWLFAVNGVALASWIFGAPFSGSLGLRVVLGVNAASLAATVTALGVNLWRADPVGRRQLKWIVYGLAVGLLPPIVAAAVGMVEPRLWWLYEVSLIAPALIPVAILIGIVRYNLLDIDRLISSTASYNILLIALLAIGLLAVPRVATAASAVLGLDPGLGQVVLSLGVAAVLVPTHRRLRPAIERLFFVERFALEQGVERLLRTLSECDGPESLLQLAGEDLDRLLRPESCVLYAQSGGGYAPTFARGRLVPPVFPLESPLIRALARRASPLALEALGRGRVELGAIDRAALETLEVPVIVPIRRTEQLVAFVCLGPKRSGDIYTSTDLALLAAVADRISAELDRFGYTEVIEQTRAMQEALRRYVPGAVAERLAEGQVLQSGEVEVSILFVDIRGYTHYSERRKPEDVFSTVNQYTQAVSHTIRAHLGSVVEFHGDGLMAVFGAPQSLSRKEEAAVRAARDVVEQIATLSTFGEGEALSVGVGIATGRAFVGNIQAVDRWIWTAIGTTTNMAARLESLTRELDAAIVIDEATWRALGAQRSLFVERAGIPIKGRSAPQDVYVIPLEQRQRSA